MSTAPVVLAWGEGRGDAGPRYWFSAPVASDDAVAVGLTVETNAVAPQGLGGECAFVCAYVTVTAAAGAVLRITPVIDDAVPETVAVADGGSVAVVQPTITIPQQIGGPPVPLVTATFDVPLLLALTRSSVVQSRWYPRGARCAIRIESVGDIGTGSFRLDGLELEYQAIRAVARSAVATT